MPLADRGLVDVAGEDQLCARVDEPREHLRAVGDRSLARAPGCADQVVVERDDAQRALRCVGQQARPSERSAHLRIRPDWCRQGRTELRPTTINSSERKTGSTVPPLPLETAPTGA